MSDGLLLFRGMPKRALERQGHKKACRAPGQIEVGDDMILSKIAFVKVIARVEETTNRWQVESYDMRGEFVTVDGDDLSRLRPPPTV